MDKLFATGTTLLYFGIIASVLIYLEKCKAVLRQLNEANRVTDKDVDEILQQYGHYFDETVVPRCSEYTNFCVSTSRLDELLFDTMANNSSIRQDKLWSCVKMLLLLTVTWTSKC